MYWVENNKVKIRLGIFFSPILPLFILLSLKIEWNNIYISIIEEDAFLEDIQFLAFFCAAIIAIVISSSYQRESLSIFRMFLFILGMILLFIAMEEISWGQRLFQIKSSEWIIGHNAQKEISIHNLNLFNNKLILIITLAGFIFSFGWIPIRYFSSLKEMKGNIKRIIQLFSPKWYLMFYFIPTFLLYSFWAEEFYLKTRFTWFKWDSSRINNFVKPDQESVEFLFAIGVFLYVASIVQSLRFISTEE